MNEPKNESIERDDPDPVRQSDKSVDCRVWVATPFGLSRAWDGEASRGRFCKEACRRSSLLQTILRTHASTARASQYEGGLYRGFPAWYYDIKVLFGNCKHGSIAQNVDHPSIISLPILSAYMPISTTNGSRPRAVTMVPESLVKPILVS